MRRGKGRKLTEFTESMIDVPIDEKKQKAKGLELADVTEEINKLKADTADAASGARKKVRALALRQRQLAECVRTGMEKQPAQLELSEARKKRESMS